MRLSNRANVSAQDGSASTALTISAAAGFGAVVKLLLYEGADANGAIQHGYTPLILAVSGGH